MKNGKQKFERAIVKLPKLGGHGVLVPGGIILTAAHCINFSTTGKMVLGDLFIEKIKTHRGDIKTRPMIVEPVTDIAVLGCPDEQILSKDAEAFENFCETTKPIALAKKHTKCREPFPVRLHDKDDTWVNGTAEVFDESSPMLWIATDKETRGGASGGPILNSAGELVGIVSNSSSLAEGKSTSRCPRPLQALPTWVVEMIIPASENHRIGKLSRPMIERLPNKPLKSLDQHALQSAIIDHVRMAICANFDRFDPGADRQQITMNVHTAQITAKGVAERTIGLIKKDFTTAAGFDSQRPPRLRNLVELLTVAANESILSLSAPDGRKNINIGQNLSFVGMAGGCADRILVEMLVEHGETSQISHLF